MKSSIDQTAEEYVKTCMCDYYCGCADAFKAGISWRDEQVKELVEALEFYSKVWNWDNCFREDLGSYVPANTEGASDIEMDRGRIARKALSVFKETKD